VFTKVVENHHNKKKTVMKGGRMHGGSAPSTLTKEKNEKERLVICRSRSRERPKEGEPGRESVAKKNGAPSVTEHVLFQNRVWNLTRRVGASSLTKRVVPRSRGEEIGSQKKKKKKKKEKFELQGQNQQPPWLTIAKMRREGKRPQ